MDLMTPSKAIKTAAEEEFMFPNTCDTQANVGIL
jgi:hypothetical protein